jgi:hypothetical protein
VRLTITGVPVGLTLDTPTTAVGDLLPTDGGTFVSTGAPVVLNYTVATSSGGFAAATLPLVLTITGGGPTLPPLGTTANIQAAAQVLPITATDTVIPRLVANSYGPTTAATLGDCRARPKGLLVSE